MKVQYKNEEYKKEEIETRGSIVITDNEGNKYRIQPYKFGGIEIMAEYGRISIEPNVSNLVYLKTIDK